MSGPELHVCGHCESTLVQLVEWEQEGPGLWYVVRRCPECEGRSSGIYPQQLVDRFENVLETGTDALVRELKGLVVENREAELARERGPLPDYRAR